MMKQTGPGRVRKVGALLALASESYIIIPWCGCVALQVCRVSCRTLVFPPPFFFICSRCSVVLCSFVAEKNRRDLWQQQRRAWLLYSSRQGRKRPDRKTRGYCSKEQTTRPFKSHCCLPCPSQPSNPVPVLQLAGAGAGGALHLHCSWKSSTNRPTPTPNWRHVTHKIMARMCQLRSTSAL